MRLLLVEDELSVAVGLVDVLRVKGYDVEHVTHAEEALTQAHRFDLLLLDATLPGMSGFELLRQLRQQGQSVRVIMLTARASEVDKVLGFELGVDDYVTKPFSLLELLGRIGAVLRRSEPAGAPVLRFGPVQVDLERFSLSGKAVALPANGFKILRVLAAHPGQVVSREQLMDQVWGAEEPVSLRTLNNVMVKIRQVIEADPEEPVFLKTVHGVGYRLDMTNL